MYVYLVTYPLLDKTQIMVMQDLNFFLVQLFFNNGTRFLRILYGCKLFMNNKQQRLGGISN